MGPGISNKHESYRTVKPGEVPVFSDATNPRLYRRRLLDWVAFQELCSDEEKKLSYGQQLLNVITNVRGNAGQRLNSIRTNISSALSRDDFIVLVERLLEVIDPEDKEASFLDTAKNWRDLMNKRHESGQSLDRYWSEYSSLVFKYAQSHGDVASSAGVQELLSLNCIIHANLPRSEFGVVLENAMRYQRDHNVVGTSGMMRSGQVIPLRSVRETFSQLSVDPRGTTVQSDEAVMSHGDSGAGPSQAPLRAGLTDTIEAAGNELNRSEALFGILQSAFQSMVASMSVGDTITQEMLTRLGDGLNRLETLQSLTDTLRSSFNDVKAQGTPTGTHRIRCEWRWFADVVNGGGSCGIAACRFRTASHTEHHTWQGELWKEEYSYVYKTDTSEQEWEA